jgi:two-component system chemotaxis response regulator CheY
MKPINLLIVDDSSIIRSRIARVLNNPGLKTVQVVGMAHDGVEAISLFTQFLPDLVTMDITMPKMDGVECTARMIDIYPECNILVISALSDKATALKALKKGAKGFLYKPFSDEELIAAFLEMTSS